MMWSTMRPTIMRDHLLDPKTFEHLLQRIRTRPRQTYTTLAICSSIVILHYLGFHTSTVSGVTTSLFQTDKTQATVNSAQALWRNLQPLLDNHTPNLTEPIVVSQYAMSPRYNASQEMGIHDHIQMPPLDILKLALAHEGFVTDLKEHIPDYPSHRGRTRRGIVSTAGDWYFPIFMVSLRMLRRTGTTLPVEVFMADASEYEAELCEKVLPKLNARCLVLSDIFEHSEDHLPLQNIAKFQYKIFAMLFSSFDEVLFLDADDFPLHDPKSLFSSELFKSTGMITWPDLWATTISPIYYLITGQHSPAPVSTRASTESGQLLVSKSTHYWTLLLAAYYNYHASVYYPLLCQGGAGRGDKATFLPAAIHMGQDFYAVSEAPLGVGHDDGHEFYTYALIQHDPVQDHALAAVDDRPRPMFLHTSTPKWNPINVLDHPGPYDLTAKWGAPSPAYADPAEAVALIEGVERQIWDEVVWVACELKDKFEAWRIVNYTCSEIREHYDTVVLPPVSDRT